jgi:hypothetical protein
MRRSVSSKRAENSASKLYPTHLLEEDCWQDGINLPMTLNPRIFEELFPSTSHISHIFDQSWIVNFVAYNRFSKENFPKILQLADYMSDVGKKHNASSGQIALAWLLAQGEDVLPIPGTKSIKVCHCSLRSLRAEHADCVTPAVVSQRELCLS